MFIPPAVLTQADLDSAIVRHPLIVSPATAVMVAIAQMSGCRTICASSRNDDSEISALHLEARSSCVLVVENHQLLGILTERDVVRLSAQRQSLETLAIGEIMAHPVITLQQEAFTDLFFAVNLLQQYHIRHLPLLDHQGQVIGLLTHESLRQLSRPIDLLHLRRVADVMAADVVCADPQMSMLGVTRLMAEHKVSSVVIVEDQESATGDRGSIAHGIVTERDIVQFQALNLNFEQIQAQDVMSTPLFSVQPDDSLWVAQQIMQQYLVKRIVVTGPQRELLGIVTQTSILKILNPLELRNLVGLLEHQVSRLEAEKLALLQSRNAELEHLVQERTASLEAKAKQEQLLTSLATQIRSSLDLQGILDRAVQAVRSLLQCDRTAIWQFAPDWSIQVVAESVVAGEVPYRGQQVHDSCFALNWLEPYCDGRIRVVSDIYSTEMTPCHRELLEHLTIRAKVLVPIIQDGQLWGLLSVIEHHAPRPWQADEISLLQQLSIQVAIAIQQATAYQQLQTELTERHRTEQRYASLAAAAPVGIYRTDVQGDYVYVNDRWCQIAGVSHEQAMGHGWAKGLHPDDRHKILMEWYTAARENQPFQLEYRFCQSDDTVAWVFGQAVAEYDPNGQISGYVGTITDITDRKQAEEKLLYNALHDALTGLPNRNLLMERLDLAIHRAQRQPNYRFAVLFLDMDRFKIINDSLGHLAGDQLLTQIAQKLQASIRTTDLACRLGGDEFVILLEDPVRVEGTIQVVERIRKEFQKPLTIYGYEMVITPSIGIVFAADDYQQASDLLRDSDIAMYRAKAEGRGNYKIFDVEMHTQAIRRLNLEQDLRKALDREEFTPYYQPIVNIHSRELIGFEALVRWQHPTRGFVAPDEFIFIAEETGLIVSIDNWMLDQVCQQLVHWKSQYPRSMPLKMSVNLSVQGLRKATLVRDVEHILATTGLAGQDLMLEITENILIDNILDTIKVLEQLKALGIQISIDDFGTGYSSLNYLHRLPIDKLKIDQSFIKHMEQENRNYRVVETIIALSKQLGLSIVAEGIETDQQLAWLQQLGCELGQGYLFSRPLTAQDIEAVFLADI